MEYDWVYQPSLHALDVNDELKYLVRPLTISINGEQIVMYCVSKHNYDKITSIITPRGEVTMIQAISMYEDPLSLYFSSVEEAKNRAERNIKLQVML